MSLIEKISNIAITVAALTVFGIALYQHWAPRTSPNQKMLIHEFLGKRLPLPSDKVRGRTGTINLFISNTCHFCTESMSFYRQLSDVKSVAPCDVKLVALGSKQRDNTEDMQTYLKSHDLKVDGLQLVDYTDVSVRGTPTLIVEDGSQVARGIWVGKLSSKQEKIVVDAVRSLCGQSS